ncbi:transport and Golgi organization protein 6 homolog [Thrips palmi]|uniref:Transport and Golgi organization protein 6 homolog n=1 Tax=Thrips palmi TaxID=161013 RepID=A0A6P9AEJ2_THRPL|nr:transport and Golgi organization protein 6 homolog [Thrips palmi]
MESAGDGNASNLKNLWESLHLLVTSKASENFAEINDLRGALLSNLKAATSALGFGDVKEIPRLGDAINCHSDIIWDFVETSLFVLLKLKEKLMDDVLSVSQQKDVRSCLQFLVSLGIQPNLVPNVMAIPSDRKALMDFLLEQSRTDMQKYERLCVVVKAILACCENSHLRSLIIATCINPLLVSLFQLSYAPLKKPSEDSNSISTPACESFVMTTDIWNRLQTDRAYFKILLHQLVKETYQPKIMFELMMLQGNQNNFLPPLWLRKSSSSLLTSRLVQPGGVAALIKAAFDSAPDTGSDWKKTDALARVITSPINHYDSIASQLFKLVEVSRDGASNMHFLILSCIRQLLDKDASVCHKFIIGPLLQPLEYVFSCENSPQEEGDIILPEEKLDALFKQIHLCFTPGSKAACVNLPGNILAPYVSLFFKLFCKLHGSASNLCKISEDILYHIICDCDQLALTRVLKCILLNEVEEDTLLLPDSFGFQFGPNGGVILQICSEPKKDLFSSSVEECGDMLIAFLELRNDSELSVLVFEVLLKLLIEMGMKPKTGVPNLTTLGTLEDNLASLMLSSEKHLGVVRLLAALVENTNVRQKLSESPEHILAFIVNFFETLIHGGSLSESGEDEDLECVFVAFMVLNVMLDNCNETTDWSVFSNLLHPVCIIRDQTKNEELQRLASRVYNLVSTCGVVDQNIPKGREKPEKTECEEAFHDACDPLLPVRGHALVQLTKLLKKRDSETLVKKEAVLCLFKENLNNSDSFIYLAAINGIVAFSSIHPDVAVKSLIEEYVAICSAGDNETRNPELRMKVGEILVKLARELGELAPKYKNELLNAFLVGTKDTDHLMRASSLSNLGEICQILGFRIGPILRELLICIQSILKFDKAVEARRASVMVVTQLLRGIEADMLDVLQDAALELYRHLKRVYCEDEDDVVRLHAQLALEELGRLAHGFLFPKISMEKKIQILP